jgi:tyrosyl-tRNA synthetase
MSVDEQLAYLAKGCVDIVRAADLRAKLERCARGGPPLVVKVGFDPTAPDLHLGHTVLIRKMKHFQDLGHRVVYVVGSFTALIGDPTGRSKTRPPLTQAEIDRNADTYRAQIFRILDPGRTEVRFNSEWLEPLGSAGWIHLAAKYNVAQMLERREFRKRHDSGQPIGVHEFLYPLAQAYDSVHLRADVELGGTDQLFNLNVGRDIMPAYGLEPQVVMTTPLLEGLDGVEKMSKSLGNYVGVTDAPGDMFGKLMSISDDLMWRYYALLTDLDPEALLARRSAVSRGELHPKQAKIDLAAGIVREFHGEEAAQAAAAEFERRFSKREAPAGVPERPMWRGTTVEHLLLAAGFAQSGSDASRKVQQGAVRLDGEKFTQARTPLDRRGSFLLQVGRNACRVVMLDPADVLLTGSDGPEGGCWRLAREGVQLEGSYASRDEALARARDLARQGPGRVLVHAGSRVTEELG